MNKKSIYELWEMLISRKKAGTARSYQDAFNRFKKDNGSHITFSDITPEFIDQWRKIMLLSVSRTTTNIYLRSFSAVLHIAYEYQLISEPPKFLFRGLGIFSSHGSNSRRHWYLPASDWHKMWVFFETQGRGYPICRKWRRDYRERYFEAVGLMLFMYLGNGMNLRDLCMLRYNKFYFQSGRKQLQFCRHKTADRTNTVVEVPILKEMQVIMDRMARKPIEGELIFPYLNDVIGDEEQEILYTYLLGRAIRDRMKTVSKALHFDCEPTPTWARHSFATNLIQAGVPKDYVSFAMAHVSNDVTHNYIAAYSYEQMVEFNSLLLHSRGRMEHVLALLMALSDEEKELIIEEFKGRI